MPDDKDESKPASPFSKEGTSAESPRATAAGAKAPASKAAAKSTSSTKRSRAEEEDDEDDDLDDEDDDLDDEDDDFDDEDDDDDEPPPPPKKAVKGKLPAGKAVAVPPARKPVPAKARAVKPAAKKRPGGRPSVRVPHPPASHFIPFALAGMGLVGAHVFWDVAYAPVAVLGISIVIWAFMGIGSANEVQSLGRPPPTEVGGSLHEVTETTKPGFSAGLVSFRTRRRPCRTASSLSRDRLTPADTSGN